jgi:hypothetical protein
MVIITRIFEARETEDLQNSVESFLANYEVQKDEIISINHSQVLLKYSDDTELLDFMYSVMIVVDDKEGKIKY